MKFAHILAAVALFTTAACQSEAPDSAEVRPAGPAVTALGVSAYEVVGDAPLMVDLLDAAGEYRGQFVAGDEAFTLTDARGHVLDLDFSDAPVFTRDGRPASARDTRPGLDLMLAVGTDEALLSRESDALEHAQSALRVGSAASGGTTTSVAMKCTTNANGTETCCTPKSCVTF